MSLAADLLGLGDLAFKHIALGTVKILIYFVDLKNHLPWLIYFELHTDRLALHPQQLESMAS